MASSRLQNYLRAHRKRLALSQKEVAFLLGAESGSKTCRYERFNRVPALETALAYEALLGRPVKELFGGTYSSIELNVIARAKILLLEIEDHPSSQRTIRKRKALTEIITPKSKLNKNHESSS